MSLLSWFYCFHASVQSKLFSFNFEARLTTHIGAKMQICPSRFLCSLKTEIFWLLTQCVAFPKKVLLFPFIAYFVLSNV